MPYQYIHIGKTGGSLIRAVLKSLPEPHCSQFLLRDHRMTLARAVEEHPHMPVFFSVRRPETLFVSAFNSRQRQGKPLYNIPWKPEERLVFSLFRSPNELAEALSASDRRLRESAELSMPLIPHIRSGLARSLGGPDVLEQHQASIAFIVLQEQLEQDLCTFLQGIGVPVESAEVSPSERVHASMDRDETALSNAGLANIRHWFRRDLEIYDWCVRQHDVILKAG